MTAAQPTILNKAFPLGVLGAHHRDSERKSLIAKATCIPTATILLLSRNRPLFFGHPFGYPQLSLQDGFTRFSDIILRDM
jgi:hypothetical protein